MGQWYTASDTPQMHPLHCSITRQWYTSDTPAVCDTPVSDIPVTHLLQYHRRVIHQPVVQLYLIHQWYICVSIAIIDTPTIDTPVSNTPLIHLCQYHNQWHTNNWYTSQWYTTDTPVAVSPGSGQGRSQKELFHSVLPSIWFRGKEGHFVIVSSPTGGATAVGRGWRHVTWHVTWHTDACRPRESASPRLTHQCQHHTFNTGERHSGDTQVQETIQRRHPLCCPLGWVWCNSSLSCRTGGSVLTYPNVILPGSCSL